MFEKAAREKVRFQFRGLITSEDLWDLDVEELDEIYKGLKRTEKSVSEESLLDKKTVEDEILLLKINIVKRVVSEKIREQDERKNAALRKQKKEKIADILAMKQDQSLQEMSKEDLEKMLTEL